MKADFYTNNEELVPVEANFLFSKECILIINGQYIEQDDQWFQVLGQTIHEDDKTSIVVFICPVSNRPTIVEL